MKYSLEKELYLAFLDAKKRKSKTINEFGFDVYHTENLKQLLQDIENRTYKPSRGIAFISEKPVVREIFAAPFRDRIIHHLIYNQINDWWDRRFIYDSYSCRKGKGTDLAIKRLYYYMRKVSKNFTESTYVVKLDIKGYFTNIDRKKLYNRVLWGLERQFLGPNHTISDEKDFKLLNYLVKEIIFDDPTKDVIIRGTKNQWKRLPKSKSLFNQKPGKGIVIGNLTSQMFSNVYLDQLDQFITKSLGFKAYGRYVDDFFIVLPEKDVKNFVRETIPIIRDFLSSLGLTLHPNKIFCQNIKHGIPYMGARLYPYHILPDYRLINNFRAVTKKVISGQKDIESIISYMGRMQHFNSQKIVSKIFSDAGWDYEFDKKLGPKSEYYKNPKNYEKNIFWKRK